MAAGFEWFGRAKIASRSGDTSAIKALFVNRDKEKTHSLSVRAAGTMLLDAAYISEENSEGELVVVRSTLPVIGSFDWVLLKTDAGLLGDFSRTESLPSNQSSGPIVDRLEIVADPFILPEINSIALVSDEVLSEATQLTAVKTRCPRESCVVNLSRHYSATGGPAFGCPCCGTIFGPHGEHVRGGTPINLKRAPIRERLDGRIQVYDALELKPSQRQFSGVPSR